MHVALLVHLTDLHLYVDRDGNLRHPSQRALGSRILRAILTPVPPLAHGLDIADGPAWSALRRRLPHVVETEAALGAECVLAQTGDVEAFGMSPGGELTAYQDLHTRVWPDLADRGCTAVDVYGNHDIWPGTFPMLAGRQAYEVITDLEAFAEPWPRETVVECDGGLRLRFHRLNTVLSQLIGGGVLARGAVGGHPIVGPWDPLHLERAIDELRAAVAADDARPQLNVLVMHHPPHLFEPGLLTGQTLGQLHGRQLLCDELASIGIQLVLAGHRHRSDPSLGATPPHSQPPLPEGLHQLVANSPTALGTDNAFQIYRLHWEPESASAGVDRLSFSYTPGRGLATVPHFEPGLMHVSVLV